MRCLSPRSLSARAPRFRPFARTSALVAVAAVAAVAAACGTTAAHGDPGSSSAGGLRTTATGGSQTSGPSTTGRVAPAHPVVYDVGIQSPTWVDPHRTTTDYLTGAVTEGRSMQVEIRYPTRAGSSGAESATAAPAYRGGPYPVIVFAHGYDVTPDTYASMLDAWVAAGYVVVSPVFPGTSAVAIAAEREAYTETDMFNQPADLAFVIKELTAAVQGTPPMGGAFLKGLVDPHRLLLAGQSDGADSIAALLYDRPYALVDLSLAVRPKGVALLSGAEWFRSDTDSYSSPISGGPPVLVVQSAADACNVPSDSGELYNLLSGKKWYLSLADATHLGPYAGTDPAAPVVGAVTTDFFSLAIGRDSASAAALTKAGNQPGVSTITSAPSVPLLAVPTPPAGVDPCALPPPTTTPTTAISTTTTTSATSGP